MAPKPRNKSAAHQIKLAGELTIYSAIKIKDKLMEALSRRKDIEIDLAKVNEIDTAGFQLLLLAKREAANQDTALHLVNHSEATLEMINLYHMAGYFGDPIVFKRKGK